MCKLIPRNPFPHSTNEIFISLFQKNNDRFFEKLLSFLNVSDGILVESGRQALYLILKTILKQGDEIIIPAFSCNVILGPIRKSCVQPVFADVNINSLNMNLENIEHLVTNKTRAVLVTHQFGYPADIDEIIEYCSEKHILVIEDAAPAFGAKYNGELVGKLGDVGFYSFQESKVISTINGGFIVGNSEPLDNIKKTFLHTESPQLSCFISTVKKWCISNPYIYFFLLNMYGLIHKKYSNADELTMELERYTLKYKNPSLFQRNLG
jgi:dTDP-4-amino-4,6-dideoxygalactose transaminase